MSKLSRRDFLKGTAAAAAAATFTLGTWKRAYAANETIRVGVIGFKSRGKTHLEGFAKLPNVKVVALCDVDADVLAKEAAAFEKKGEKVETYTDVRKLLEDKNIDVISTATPNH